MTTEQETSHHDPTLAARLRDTVLNLYARYIQPSARELLERLEQEHGWAARWEAEKVLVDMIHDKEVSYGLREYLAVMVEHGELDEALAGVNAPEPEVASTIDALVRQSAVYRQSGAFSEMISFMARFKEYAPFNNMLVRIQNPSCGFYATEKDWWRKFSRTLIEDARPMLILAPKHPVMLVYDLDQTEGEPVPEKLLDFASFKGDYNSLWMEHMLENAKGHGIRVDFKMLSSTRAGFATTARGRDGYKMRIAVHDGLDEPSRLGVLCHELAHILLGHLGSDRDRWWTSRANLTLRTVEIEAEATAYIATRRLGLQGTSAAYVSSYIKEGKLPPSVSIDLIAKVSGLLERMAREKMPPKKSRLEPRPRRFT